MSRKKRRNPAKIVVNDCSFTVALLQHGKLVNIGTARRTSDIDPAMAILGALPPPKVAKGKATVSRQTAEGVYQGFVA
jgi:hypothetical protein